jgi:hypothetical protein
MASMLPLAHKSGPLKCILHSLNAPEKDELDGDNSELLETEVLADLSLNIG